MMMVVVVVTNCVTDGGVNDMKMVGMLVVVTIKMSIISISIRVAVLGSKNGNENFRQVRIFASFLRVITNFQN